MQDFEAVYNKVTAAYVVLIAWFSLASVEESVLVDNFLKVENSTRKSEDTVWRTAVETSGGSTQLLHNSYTTPTHLERSPQARGQLRLQ